MLTTAELPVAILAGGLATRLRPITERIPKSLVSVGGLPFLAHQLRLLRANGFQHVILCVGHLGEMIVRDFGDGSAFGLRIDYSFDGDRLLGTGGAIRKALPFLGGAFGVLYGDSYLPFDYGAAVQTWEKSNQPALMTVFRNAGRWDRSNVEFAAERVVRYDKEHPTPAMEHIDYGFSLFRAEVFAPLPPDTPVDLASIQCDLASSGRLAGCEVPNRFYEIGSPEGLAELDRLLASK